MPDANAPVYFRALIVSDSDVSQEIYGEQLNSLGIDSCATSSFLEANEVIKAVAQSERMIDLIILDRKDVDETYLKFVLELENSYDVSASAIILVSDKAAEELHGLKDSFSAFQLVSRPVSPTQFEELVENILSGKVQTQSKDASVDQQGHEIDVLIAEDNEINQIVFTEALNELDVRFEIASNGEEAVALWEKHNPAIIFMDVSMPVMGGHEATQIIRKIEAETNRRHTPICAITAHALKGDKEDCIKAGMDDYMSKPVSPDMLSKKIDELLPVEAERNAL